MRIYSMTATFGKLEHQTLTLQPGLNIIEAPNEWGKSTWCAFLTAMFYGIDTRERSTVDRLSDKEHYAPWSGSPMSGRMDLHWQGRDITIERTSKGRVPMGQFRAYETDSGLLIPELTAANCGQMLLGVEKSVFLRTAFLRLTDMPVTHDEALVARLNALVTTGDESNTTARFSSKLRELKNACRYHKTGLIPQAMAQKDALETKLQEVKTLSAQFHQLQHRQKELEHESARLENHRCALEYAAAQENQLRHNAAQEECAAAEAQLTHWLKRCDGLPPLPLLEKKTQELESLHSQWSAAVKRVQMLTPPDAAPIPLAPLQDIPPEKAVAATQADFKKHHRWRSPLPLIFMLLALLAGAAGFFLLPEERYAYLSAIGGGVIAAACLIFYLVNLHQAKKLAARYSAVAPLEWVPLAREYEQAAARSCQSHSDYLHTRQQLDAQIADLEAQMRRITGGMPPQDALTQCTAAITAWERRAAAQREFQRCSDHADAIARLLKAVPPPAMEDSLTLTLDQTTDQLAETNYQLRKLQLAKGQLEGQMVQLGRQEDLQKALDQITRRIAQLETYDAALTLAQETLIKAREELQRRFAPQITAHARSILSRLTGSRYDRLMLDRELNLLSGAQPEDTLHSPLWRSDGTADQLYFSLRLAVSNALAPAAPMILDDALVRFDDERLRAALRLLKEEAQNKQILLFTCQSREKNLI